MITPSELKSARLDRNNSLVTEAIDFFIASLINGSYYDKPFNNEYAVEVGEYKFCNKAVLDAAITSLRDAGWIVRHGSYYSPKHACPSHAIFINSQQLESSK